jgi:hypothetical protein
MALILYVFGERTIFHGQIIETDGHSQIAQARLMLGGHWTLVIPQRLRDVIFFPYSIATIPSYTQYTPGYVLALMPALAAGLPAWSVNVACSALTLWATTSLARRLEGPVVALAVGLLLLASPHALLMSGSGLNHSLTAMCLWTAAWAWMPDPTGTPLPARWRGELARHALGGLALGLAVMTRPLTGLAHGLVWGVTWLALMIGALRRRRAEGVLSAVVEALDPARLWARLGAAVVGMALPTAFFLLYNAQTTGHPLVMGYQVANPMLHRLGFYISKHGGLNYTPRQAIGRFAADLCAWNDSLFGLAIGSWTLIVFWWLRTRLPRHQWVTIGLILTQMALYACYQYHDLFWGPRFLYETVPGLALLAGAGMGPVLRRGGARAGGVLLIFATLAVAAFLTGMDGWVMRYKNQVTHAVRFERFMARIEPIREPTAVVIPDKQCECVGPWFMGVAKGQPQLWFVPKSVDGRARAVPELAGFRWVEFR